MLLAQNAQQAEPRLHTWKEFLRLDDEDRRELIDGVFLEVEVPTALHEHIVATLTYHLYGWVRPRRAGQVLTSGYKVRISERRGVMPDVQFYRAGNKLPPQGLEEGHPDLAVEVISESSRRYDRVTKQNWYAGLGVPEYWIVDPSARTLERLVLRDGHYLITDSLAETDVFHPESFPGLTIPLGELWEAEFAVEPQAE